MKYYRRMICYILVAVIMLVSFSRCSIMEPPSIAKVERRFNKHYDDIIIVVNFMISSQYETIIIDSDERTGLVNTDGYHIESVELVLDKQTEEAVNRLLDTGYDNIDKVRNTIQFQQWYWMNDVGCGVAYAINSPNLPEIQYVTELIPMETEGWYYYVYDFNQWRLENSTD